MAERWSGFAQTFKQHTAASVPFFVFFFPCGILRPTDFLIFDFLSLVLFTIKCQRAR